MLICFDVGNTQVYGGFYDGDVFTHTFRFNTKIGWSSDQLGLFLRSFTNEHRINTNDIDGVVISSVVPSLDYHLKNASLKYFNTEPLFIKVGVKTGLSIKYKAAHEVGADLICSAVGAAALYPNTDIIVIDMGTATTITAINAKREFVTGLILPGPHTQVASLSSSAEKLFAVELIAPKSVLANNTSESIQSGIFYSHLGGVNYIIEHLAREAFSATFRNKYKVVATGGLAKMYKGTGMFDTFDMELVLKGMVKIFTLNRDL